MIVAEDFDVDESWSIPWQRRPLATVLLAELQNANRERNRIKIRVRAAMAAQAKDEGRFLGGRSPYRYS